VVVIVLDTVLVPVIVDRGLDRVLGEHRAVDLDRREAELLDDLGVADLLALVEALALEPLGREAGRRDRRAAPEALELGVLDLAVSPTLIWSCITSPHSGAPTSPTPTSARSLISFWVPNEPTLRGFS
jgi:hypothetical protein